MKQRNLWEVLLKIAVAALTAALTALTTTSCMGHGPFFMGRVLGSGQNRGTYSHDLPFFSMNHLAIRKKCFTFAMTKSIHLWTRRVIKTSMALWADVTMLEKVHEYTAMNPHVFL